MMKFYSGLMLLLLLLCSCASTQYYAPIKLSQKEIAAGRLLNGEKWQAQKILDCGYQGENFGKKECIIIVCKTDRNQPTGLSCEASIPQTIHIESVHFLAKPNLGNSKYFALLVQAKLKYESNNPEELENLCKKEDVLCYLNNKFYPASKIA